jgi:hypothetical protein
MIVYTAPLSTEAPGTISRLQNKMKNKNKEDICGTESERVY